MLRTERELLLGLLVASLFLSSVTPDCKGCTIEKDCCRRQYSNNTECDKEFESSINASVDPIKESDDLTLQCYHNIPPLNLSYTWFKNDKNKTERYNKTFFVKKARRGDIYKCCVRTSCGDCASDPFEIDFKSSSRNEDTISINAFRRQASTQKTQNNGVVLLIICGVSALALILVMGVVMKIKLKKDQARHKERMRKKRLEREQEAQYGGPIPIPR